MALNLHIKWTQFMLVINLSCLCYLIAFTMNILGTFFYFAITIITVMKKLVGSLWLASKIFQKVWTWANLCLNFWLTAICETKRKETKQTKRNEMKICNLWNGNMLMSCKICVVNFAKSLLRSWITRCVV